MDEDEFVQEEYNPHKETYTESIKFNDKPFTVSNNDVDETTFVRETHKKAPKNVIIEEVDPEIIEAKPIKKYVEKKKKIAVEKHISKKEVKGNFENQAKLTSEKKIVKSKPKMMIEEEKEDDSIEISFNFLKKIKAVFTNNKNGADKKMKKSKNKINNILILIALLAIIGISVFIINIDKIFPDKGVPVAVVNNQVITTKDVEQTQKTFSSLNKDEILNQTIMNILLVQEAKKLGLETTEQEVDDTIKSMLSAYQISEDDFKLDLEKQNLTLEDMKDFYKILITANKLFEKTAYVGITNITADEIKKFYKNNTDKIGNATLDEVSDQIESYLLQQKKAEASNNYIAALMAAAKIQILNAEQTNVQDTIASNLSSVEVEKYAKCASDNGLDKNAVLFIYSDSCPHCQRMKPIVTELETEEYKFKWASVYDTEIKTVLNSCYSDVVAGGVPQFICAKNGQTIVGERSKEILQDFAESCNK